jgi:predicted DNA-binding protein with PD1-like motif
MDRSGNVNKTPIKTGIKIYHIRLFLNTKLTIFEAAALVGGIVKKKKCHLHQASSNVRHAVINGSAKK